MGVFGAVFGRRGDAGFSVPLLGVSSGVGGFNVATLLRLVREKVRPARSDGGREREKVRPARSKHPKIGVLWRAGRVFSRKLVWRGFGGRTYSRRSRWSGRAGRTFSRKSRWRGRAGRTYSRRSRWSGRAGRVFSRKRGWRGCAGQVCGPAVVGSHRASFDATRSRTGPSIGSVNPSIRSYAHLVVAGCGRPHWPQQPTPQRKALTKGKCLPVKAVTSLDNGRKWRVSAGRALELLR